MARNLVIVESPAKAKTIEKFLGEDFMVKSSYGHVRDLPRNDVAVDIENHFLPSYTVLPDKKQVISELKKLSKKAEAIWLATDEDREGEAISWHLYEVLELQQDKTKRIVFHEITKPAIEKAIASPRAIDKKLVDAQQARRVLDRLVGFELSPLLWKKVKPSLSAGRVQSVAVRLIAEREKDIENFATTSSFRVTANFNVEGKNLSAELPRRLEDEKTAESFLNALKGSAYAIKSIETKPGKKSPSAPFTTSTLQQEASRKLGYSVSRTMTVAQKLYESGKITYMRTDSVNLSELAITACKDEIIKLYGADYANPKQYVTKAQGAQEAHEAIRPTYIENRDVDGDDSEQRLYELIWKRTVASQMADAQLEKTTVAIEASNNQEVFNAKGEVIKFEGFLKVYIESTDEEPSEEQSGLLPPMTKGQELPLLDMFATERFANHPPRYSEASLVRKMEEQGIGRPSTYAPTISTIQKRGYVEKEDRPGVERSYKELLLENDTVTITSKTEITGREKSKLFPTDIGVVVNDFLVKYFEKVLDYGFTADVEKEFDEIARGNKVWNEMIKDFYTPFHDKVQDTLENTERATGERLLGTDPESGKNVYVRIGRYGPMVQIGEVSDEEKPKFAGLRKEFSLSTVTLEDALEMFKLPRTVGEFEDNEVIAAIGRYGPYLRHDGSFYSLKEDDPNTIQIDRAKEIILLKREADKQKVIREYPENAEVKVLNGRYGPYINIGKKNYRIPKDREPKELTLEDCLKIAEEAPAKKGRGRKKS